MKRLLRFCLRALTTLALLAVTLALLFAWYVYTPAAPAPQLAGTLDRSSIDVGGANALIRSICHEACRKPPRSWW